MHYYSMLLFEIVTQAKGDAFCCLVLYVVVHACCCSIMHVVAGQNFREFNQKIRMTWHIYSSRTCVLQNVSI
jgi:hypothetical protein